MRELSASDNTYGFNIITESDTFRAGEGCRLTIAVAEPTTSIPSEAAQYEMTDTVCLIYVADPDGAQRVRVVSPSDIPTITTGSRATRDTTNGCNLCFGTISHHKLSLNNLDCSVKLRTFGGDADHSDRVYVKVSSIRNCDDCQSAIIRAVEKLIEAGDSQIVSRVI